MDFIRHLPHQARFSNRLGNRNCDEIEATGELHTNQQGERLDMRCFSVAEQLFMFQVRDFTTAPGEYQTRRGDQGEGLTELFVPPYPSHGASKGSYYSVFVKLQLLLLHIQLSESHLSFLLFVATVSNATKYAACP